MQTILFFDDWPIQEQRGLDRRWFQAEPWPGLAPATDPLADEPFRLYLELEQARLYAVRVDAEYLFACLPQKTLTGDYVADRLVGWGDWTGQ